MTCKADGCYTRRGSGKSTFRIPHPKQKPVLSEKWLINLQLENYVHSSNNFICEDHFEQSCFEGNFMSRLLGNRQRQRLKADAVPTKFRRQTTQNENSRKRELSQDRHIATTEREPDTMMLKYCPKRQEFDYPCMVARTQLAVIDNNLNIGRQQKTTNQGNPCFAPHCPRSTGRWSVRKVFEVKSYQFKTAIIHIAVTNQYRRGHTAHQRRSLQLPKNIARTPAPLKEDLIDEHMCRFRLT